MDMAKVKKWTVVFIIGAVICIAGYDVYAIATGGLEASISHTMIEWSYKYPIFTFLMGFTMGHLFWRMRDTPTTIAISANTRETAEPDRGVPPVLPPSGQ